jgi:hypothetical protein
MFDLAHAVPGHRLARTATAVAARRIELLSAEIAALKLPREAERERLYRDGRWAGGVRDEGRSIEQIAAANALVKRPGHDRRSTRDKVFGDIRTSGSSSLPLAEGYR